MKTPLIALTTLLLLCSAVPGCKKDPLSFTPTNPVAKNFVHVENAQLLDSNSQPLTLKGVNLGSWLLWEAWVWGGGLNSETWINQTIAAKTSDAYTQNFRETLYKNYITRADIQSIASLGLNSIRVPFNHRFFDDGGTVINYARFDILDSLIQWCTDYHVYIIPDFHALPGGQNPLFISDPDNIKVWDSDTDRAQAAKIWKAIAARYVNTKIILGYDLINEPSTSDDKGMVDLYVQLIQAIRSVDNNHLLIVEGNNYAQDFSIFNTILDNNQIFSFHFYPWLSSSSSWPDKLKVYDDFARKVKVPMWCGEWGEMSIGDERSIKSLLSDPGYAFCGNAFWTWKKVLVSSNLPANEIQASDDWVHLINNQNKTGSQSYEQIADGFLQSVLYNNTIPSPDARSMLAQ
jgi:hypothetical protein